MATCRGNDCGAPILWVVAVSTGRSFPVDADPHPDGNVEVHPAPPMSSMSPTATVHAQPPLIHQDPLHMPHHFTCPNAAEFRTRR
jgi:hypothetical protein